MRFFIRLSFKGTNYSGWQVQENADSIQAQLSRALSLYLGENIDICGAGRTDSGVHAINYIAHFDCTCSASSLVLEKSKECIYKLNAILPSDICVYAFTAVPETAHARFDAVKRTYRYHIHSSKNPFIEPFSVYVPYTLDLTAMNQAASFLLGTHDFTSFSKLHGGNKTAICAVSEAFWTTTTLPFGDTLTLSENSENLMFQVSADRFLRNMVRAFVGTLLDVGRGKITPPEVQHILQKKNRNAAGSSVAAQGLFLYHIDYPYPVL